MQKRMQCENTRVWLWPGQSQASSGSVSWICCHCICPFWGLPLIFPSCRQTGNLAVDFPVSPQSCLLCWLLKPAAATKVIAGNFFTPFRASLLLLAASPIAHSVCLPGPSWNLPVPLLAALWLVSSVSQLPPVACPVSIQG